MHAFLTQYIALTGLFYWILLYFGSKLDTYNPLTITIKTLMMIMMMMMMMMMNCLCGMVDRRKVISLIYSQGYCQRSSPSFKFSWMKLWSSDNHYTTAPPNHYTTVPQTRWSGNINISGMHFREPLISKTPRFLAINHV